MNSPLTIVMPLKGRPLFTLRFLWHANKARLPYSFIIADGEVHPELAALIENSAETFPNLDIDYHRYPDDHNFLQYYAKMADVMQRVRTPYVKIADNDDLLAPVGLAHCVDFLDACPDYVCCSGGISGFSVHPQPCNSFGMVVGPLNKLTDCHAPRDRALDLKSPSTTERLLAGLRNTWSFYAVFRAPALAQMWQEVQEIAPTNFALKERFLAMRALTMGKAQSQGGIVTYWRQYWTSLQLHWTSSDSAVRRDFIYYLLRSRFTDDFANILNRISQLAADNDCGDAAEIAERLRGPLGEWVRDVIGLDFGPYAALRRHLRTYAPRIVRWLKTRRRLSVVLERRHILQKLTAHGATPEYLDKFKSELAQIEDVLTGDEFRQFLKLHIPKLELPS